MTLHHSGGLQINQDGDAIMSKLHFLYRENDDTLVKVLYNYNNSTLLIEDPDNDLLILELSEIPGLYVSKETGVGYSVTSANELPLHLRTAKASLISLIEREEDLNVLTGIIKLLTIKEY